MNLDKHQRNQFVLEDFYCPEVDEAEDLFEKFSEKEKKICRGELKQLVPDLWG